MMKKMKILLFGLISFLLFGLVNVVNAKVYTESEIPDDSYVIGTHLFSSSMTPSSTSFYSGIVDSSVVMLGSTTIDASQFQSSEDFVIYYKITDDFWIDSITGNDLVIPESGFDITHVNGECVDSSCMGNAIPVKFLSTAGLEDVFETKTVNVGYGEKIAAADIPFLNNRPGYQFECWTVKGSDDCFDLNTPITDDMIPEGESTFTLETKWNQIEYTITYTNFDGTVQEKTCRYGSIGAEANDCHFEEYLDLFAARPSYTFAGWSTSPDGGTVYNVSSSMASILGNEDNITLYAIWDTMKYTISYQLDGGTFTDTISPQTSFNVEDTSITLPSVSKVGYVFKNWSYNNVVFDGNTLPKNDITLTAVWEPITYSFVYQTQNVTCTYDQECVISITDGAVPEGRKFAQWYILDGSNKIYLGNTVKNFTTTNETFTLHPEYEMLSYHVSYDYDGGVVTDANFTSFQYDALNLANNQTYTLHVPTKVGYDFVGWEVQGSGLVINNNTSVTVVGAGDVLLKALWDEKTYSIEYYNGTSLVSSDTCSYTTCLVTTTTVTKDAYVFDGWKSETSGLVYSANQAISNTDLVAGSTIRLVAKWTNDYRYVVSYDLNGGSFEGDAPTSYLDGEAVSLPTPLREGYTFGGWTVNGTSLTGNTVIGYKEDLKLEAKWIAHTYTIQFAMDGVTIPDLSCTYDIDCTFGTHTDVVPANKKLLGWSMVEGGPIYYGDNLTVKNLTKDANAVITLYAVLEDTTVYQNVSYYLDGGQLENGTIANRVVHGTTISLPTPTKIGYTFVGWRDVNSDTIIEDGDAVTTDLLLVAQWEIQTYSIQYVDENGDSISVDAQYPTSYSYGTEKIVLPGNTYFPEGVNRWKVNGVDLTSYVVYGEETSSFVIQVSNYEDITVVGYKVEETEDPIDSTRKVNLYNGNELIGVLLVQPDGNIVAEGPIADETMPYYDYSSHKWKDADGNPFEITKENITSDISLYLVN